MGLLDRILKRLSKKTKTFEIMILPFPISALASQTFLYKSEFLQHLFRCDISGDCICMNPINDFTL